MVERYYFLSDILYLIRNSLPVAQQTFALIQEQIQDVAKLMKYMFSCFTKGSSRNLSDTPLVAQILLPKNVLILENLQWVSLVIQCSAQLTDILKDYHWSVIWVFTN